MIYIGIALLIVFSAILGMLGLVRLNIGVERLEPKERAVAAIAFAMVGLGIVLVLYAG